MQQDFYIKKVFYFYIKKVFYFYIKKVFYACYVKNIVLPISFLTNIGNKKGKWVVGGWPLITGPFLI